MRLTAGTLFASRRELGRPRHQFRAVLGQCGEGRAVPVRQPGPPRARAHRAARAHRGRLAWLSQRRLARPALRLSRLRPLRARAGSPLQCQQAPARSLCQAACRTAGLERRAFRLSHRQPARGPFLRPPRQCPRHAQGRRCRRDLQLGPPRNPPQHPLGRHHHLRSPCQRPDPDPRGRAAEPARHLWRALLAGDDRAPQAARRHHDRAAADPCALSTTASWSRRSSPITGATTPCRFLRRSRVTPRTIRWMRSAPRWRGCTTPASK